MKARLVGCLDHGGLVVTVLVAWSNMSQIGSCVEGCMLLLIN